MSESIPHAMTYGMHYVVCKGIPHSRITISHDHVIMWNASHATWLGLLLYTRTHNSH